MANGNTALNAVIGAIITIGLSFTGFSPLLGGGIAGYLQAESPKRGAFVGALSGMLAIIPLLLLGFLGFFFMAVPVGGFRPPGGPELLIIMFLLVPLMIVWFVGLSAIGGYVGAVIRGD